MFGQTVTASGDTMRQIRNARFAHPRSGCAMDIECEAGCGVVPFRYRDKNFVNALQWAIGLELFLLVDDPWRIFLTTDHPNGAPFTTYPHLIRLLMDKSFRNEHAAHVPRRARRRALAGDRARVHALRDRDHDAGRPGAHPRNRRPRPSRRRCGGRRHGLRGHRRPRGMFATPALVFKDGVLVARAGSIVNVARGATHMVQPAYDRGIETTLRPYFERFRGMRLPNVAIDADELIECGSARLIAHECSGRAAIYRRAPGRVRPT